MHLTKREISTILAGLRLLQLHPDKSVSAIATNCGEFEPLAALEIDQLCEKLNFDGEAPTVNERAVNSLPGAVKKLLAVPEVNRAAANWATDELLNVRNLLHFSK